MTWKFLDVVFSGDIRMEMTSAFAARENRSAASGTAMGFASYSTPRTESISTVLIEYQQAKRSYYLYEDSVWQGLRSLCVAFVSANTISNCSVTPFAWPPIKS